MVGMKAIFKEELTGDYCVGVLRGDIDSDIQKMFGMLIMMGYPPETVRRAMYEFSYNEYDKSETD